MEGNFVAYYRVSTQRQGRSGLGLDAQRKTVADFLNGGNWNLIGEFTEVESGKRVDRVELRKAMALCKKRKAKLIIAKLDRLARNVHFISGLMESKINFVACDMPSATPLTIHIHAAVAEDEARMISKRTIDGLAAAKRRGTVLGGPKIAAINQGRQQAAQANAMALAPALEHVAGLSALAAATELNRLKITTAGGSQWSASTVIRARNRLCL